MLGPPFIMQKHSLQLYKYCTMNQYFHPLAVHSVFDTGNPWKVIKKIFGSFVSYIEKNVINTGTQDDIYII